MKTRIAWLAVLVSWAPFVQAQPSEERLLNQRLYLQPGGANESGLAPWTDGDAC